VCVCVCMSTRLVEVDGGGDDLLADELAVAGAAAGGDDVVGATETGE
jgi:hypothetical protein